MEETTNQAQQEPAANEKLHTQAEVDQIVRDRLARERAKFEGYDELKAKAEEFDKIQEANKSELQKAQDKAAELEKKLNDLEKEKSIKTMRDKVAADKGVPADLLTGETEEACTSQADAILKFAAANGYPAVRDSGEPNHTGKTSTKTQFKDWMEKAMQ